MLDLSGSAGSLTSGQLTLEAGDSLSTDGNIIFGAGSKITDANSWSVTLAAGLQFRQPTRSIRHRKHLSERRQRADHGGHHPIIYR